MDYSIDRGMRVLPESSWRPVFQRSIDAFYEAKRDEGIAACLTLLNEPALPADIRALTFRNQTYYASPLTDLIPDARWRKLMAEPGDESQLCDPSPAAADDRFVVLVRDEGENASSATTAVTPGDDLLPELEIIALPTRDGSGATIDGLRPFFWENELFVAALFSEDGDERTTRAGLLKLTSDAASEVAALGPRAGFFQHGWSPFVTADGPHCVAWWEPTEVFRFDEVSGGFERVALRMAPHLTEHFQGGSQGVAVPGGYLFLVNETVAFDDGSEVALSRFVRIDERFQIDAISSQFFISNHGKDVATGLVRRGEQLIAGFTSAGQSAILAVMNLSSVMESLMPVAVPGRRTVMAPE